MQIIEPPRYQNYWIEDLPPSYSSIIDDEQVLRGYTRRLDAEPATGRLSNPPPYSEIMRLEVAPDGRPSLLRSLRRSASCTQTSWSKDTNKIERSPTTRANNNQLWPLGGILNCGFTRNQSDSRGVVEVSNNRRSRSQPSLFYTGELEDRGDSINNHQQQNNHQTHDRR